jgi:hypothetical protein
MKTVSKWGGYGASFFTLATFGEGLAYALTQGDLPDWFAYLTAASFILAALSGLMCLTTGFIAYLKDRRGAGRPALSETG